MNPFVNEISKSLSEHVNLPATEISKTIETPHDPELGDYAFPCFRLAKEFRKAPQAIAADLAAKMSSSPGWPPALVSDVKNVGPYLNFFVNKTKLIEMVLKRVREEGAGYGASNTGAGKNIVIDYSSPNIAKHLAVYHLRTTMMGHALRNLYTAIGYNCTGINHLGDWGTQFGKLIVAFQRWGDEEALKDGAIQKLNELYVRFHKEAETDSSLEEEARKWFKKLEDGDSTARSLWQQFRDASLTEFNKVYDMLGVQFSSFTGESFYNDKMDATIEKIEKLGLAKVSDGALIVDLEDYDMPACLLRKKDGATLYATRDICAAEYRWGKYHFEKMLYVVGSEQRLAFQQLFKVLELMGNEWAKKCVHVDLGLILFKKEGEDRVGKGATREGGVILLEDVLLQSIELSRNIVRENDQEGGLSSEEVEQIAKCVGIGAVVFHDLSSKRVKDVIFDWDEILNPKGRTGPYVQYTHARACSILRKYGQPVDVNIDFDLLKEEEEFQIVKALESYPNVLRRAAEAYEPYMLANYLLDLCTIFASYYHKHRVLGQAEELTKARILLIDCVRQVVKNGLAILGINAPEKM